MSEVFEAYERQYCEISASLSRKCTSAAQLDGGMRLSVIFVISIFVAANRGRNHGNSHSILCNFTSVHDSCREEEAESF